jgi:hypothetical protein
MHMAVAEAVVADRQAGRRSFVIAATREQVAEANAVIHEAMVAAGHVDNTHTVATRAGERIGAGDIVATRRNDRNLDVANRETWTVTAVTDEGGLRVSGPAGERMLPAAYLATEVELAYAITAHGAQGHTVDHAHLILDEHTTAAAAYVGLTRGRHSNTAHILTADETDAREQWSMVFARGRADQTTRRGARRPASSVAGPCGRARPAGPAASRVRAGRGGRRRPRQARRRKWRGPFSTGLGAVCV